jgi:TPR repeat protein
MAPILDFLYPSPMQFVASIPSWAGLGDGIKAFQKQEYALALHEFKILADDGDADAQFFIGSLYQQGEGVIKNLPMAVPWLEKAAKQRHHGALNALGVIYASEKEFRDYARAEKCFEAAASTGFAEVQYNLGLLLANGLGSKHSLEEAAQLFQKSAEQGLAAAQHKLGRLYEQGELVPTDLKQAMSWYLKAANQDYAQAQLDLGLMYHLDKGIEVDEETALHWLSLAAKQGILAAQTQLALLYEHGTGIKRDRLKAFYWYSQAAELGDFDAQYALGKKYANGEGVPQDFVLAYVWFNLAGAQGHETAGTDRERLFINMTPRQMERGQELSREYFDRYVVKPNVED